jgi:magnesium transporter
MQRYNGCLIAAFLEGVFMKKLNTKVFKKIIPGGRQKIGLPPGTLVHTGERKVDQVRITAYDYDQDSINRRELADIEKAFGGEAGKVKWINIDGLHDIALIEKIGQHFKIHPLVLEDIVHTSQRPKMEEFDGHIYVVLKMLTVDEQQMRVSSEQVSLVLGEDYVISFQEARGDVFDFVRERLTGSKGRIRKLGADYLLYALVDSIIDNYFVVLEAMSDKLESLQHQVTVDPSEQVLQQIHDTKRQMLSIKRAVWPLRELISNMQKSESELLNEYVEPFLRDLYDHIVQIIDTTETLREMSSGVLDIYLSIVSNRMNSVMQVLTVIATIFIPLTFVAGIYGMNFENMPELGWEWSYPWGFWIVIVVLLLIMLAYFKRKKWF